MKNNLKAFLLRTIPYMLSLVGGLMLFFIALVHIESHMWQDLIVGIASTLVAIPVVFLLYNYSDYKLSSKINKTMFDSISFEINATVLKVLLTLKDMLGIKQQISWKVIENMIDKDSSEIKSKITIGAKDISVFQSYKNELSDLLYKISDNGILDNDQTQILVALTKELSHVINELEVRGNKEALSKDIERILSLIDSWFDTCEEEALKDHRHFQLAMDTGKNPENN